MGDASGLSRELHGEVPAALRDLTDEQFADLTEAVREARHRQAAALAEAGENAFGQLPRIVRGPIRRLFS